jgi:hypothetical protein
MMLRPALEVNVEASSTTRQVDQQPSTGPYWSTTTGRHIGYADPQLGEIART